MVRKGHSHPQEEEAATLVLTKDEMELIREDLECIKTLPNPPQAIKVTMEAVALLLGYPPRQARVCTHRKQLLR